MNLQEERQRPGRGRAWLALALTAGLAACGGGGETVADTASTAAAGTGTAQITSARRETSTVTVSTIAQPTNTEGRLLASNCFQCHGTGGTGGFEEIRGKSANELIEFFDKPASRDIMAAHAQGYTAEQLRKVAAYLQQ
ncbi:MAG TPA: c-type cytochrome [Rubrivivax sp.]|nr:c-type cytochrome [Rubrivivax sp.]